MTSKYTHGTWADEFGRWHARVSNVNVSDTTARNRARRAITREILDREFSGPHRISLRLEVVARDDSTITFREKE